MNQFESEVICVACSVFRRELQSLQKEGRIGFPIRYVDSMLHMQPLVLCRRLDALLGKILEEGSTVLLVFGECHNHMSECESHPRVRRVKGRNCMEIVLGPDQYEALSDEGVFFLMPEWARRWREVFEKELRLQAGIAKDLMRGMHTKLVYLDTKQIPAPLEHLADASEALGLPYEVLPVDLEHLLGGIREALERTD